MKGICIGTQKIDVPMALGPMAGVTDLPFRLLCCEMGCGLVVTEMVSAKAMYYKNKNTVELLHTEPEERPVAAQLFGSEPELMADMALTIEDRFDMIDINAGCPVPKVVKNGEGSALLKDPGKLGRIVEEMTKKLHKPVTVKIRKGFSRGEENCAEIARICEAAGASAIAVHGRVREEFFTGEADLQAIRHVKEAVKIPVIGNGDIHDGPSAERMLRETGCDGIMIAQAAKGNPWIFREIKAYLELRESGISEEEALKRMPKRPDTAEVKAMILRHTRMLTEENGEHMAVLKMRSHASWYLQGLPNAAKIRVAINNASTYEELEEILRIVE